MYLQPRNAWSRKLTYTSSGSLKVSRLINWNHATQILI